MAHDPYPARRTHHQELLGSSGILDVKWVALVPQPAPCVLLGGAIFGRLCRPRSSRRMLGLEKTAVEAVELD